MESTDDERLITMKASTQIFEHRTQTFPNCRNVTFEANFKMCARLRGFFFVQ